VSTVIFLFQYILIALVELGFSFEYRRF